jgi:hypothetical protein
MSFTLLQLIVTSLGSAVLVKFLDILYSEVKFGREKRSSSKDIVAKHLDPILKAADELVGQIRSLAQKDFQPVLHLQSSSNNESLEGASIAHLGVLYLFANFWARIAVLRQEGIYVNLAAAKVGRQLLQFIESFESRAIRIVDRDYQRLIGESMLKNDKPLTALTFHDFVFRFRIDEQFRLGFGPLNAILSRVQHRKERQQILLYGLIVHCLIDTLDKKHTVTRDRPSYPNKLSQRTKRDLRFRIFNQYLRFGIDREKFLGRAETRK